MCQLRLQYNPLGWGHLFSQDGRESLTFTSYKDKVCAPQPTDDDDDDDALRLFGWWKTASSLHLFICRVVQA